MGTLNSTYTFRYWIGNCLLRVPFVNHKDYRVLFIIELRCISFLRGQTKYYFSSLSDHGGLPRSINRFNIELLICFENIVQSHHNMSSKFSFLTTNLPCTTPIYVSKYVACFCPQLTKLKRVST